ncbi:MAG: UDP-N-acetylglucosamine 2-epimerase (non-hydrolyzing) [bacterium TMED264]|nr:MAG: UDP-N-acetylglucosamine 2-epimerase (non-hydrolyzing) [bacterium TMED264]
MKKILTIVGTRPEIIKMSRVIAEFDKHTKHILVHTGQNFDYELNQVFFEELEIRKPDYFLNATGDNVSETIGKIISMSDEVLKKEDPDAVLIYGDTNSCLSVISAKRRKIPIFHFEAGNRCFDQRVPEEINRKIVDHLSDINLPLTEHARQHLLNEGLRPETIIKTGSPMGEVLNYYESKINNSHILESFDLIQDDYILVSSHREENIESNKNFHGFIEMLLEILNTYGKKIIVSTHPRTMKKLTSENKIDLNPRIIFSKPLGFLDYVFLQKNAFCVLSDSGTITEEASILNFPAVMLRDAHERPEGMDEGTLIMSGMNKDSVANSIDIVRSFDYKSRVFRIVEDYQSLNFSKKIIKIVHSYIDFVNRTVWFKDLS